MVIELSAERLRELLHYDSDTGFFAWKARSGRGSHILGGDVAGYVTSSTYIAITIDGREYKAHRLAWLHVTGEWPKADIDHINMLPWDNRWVNLRTSSNSQNLANTLGYGNPSGKKGVYLRGGKWRAASGKDGKLIHFGTYPTPGQAALAYAIGAEKHHGEFSRPKLEDVALDIFMTEWRKVRWEREWVNAA